MEFVDQQKADSVTSKRITEQLIKLTKRKINRPGYEFSKNFRYKRVVKSRTRSLPRIERSPMYQKRVSVFHQRFDRESDEKNEIESRVLVLCRGDRNLRLKTKHEFFT